MGEGVCGQNNCYHVAIFLDSIYFDMQHDNPLKKVEFWPHPGICGQNICYHVSAFAIPFYLICIMTLFLKSRILTYRPPGSGWRGGGVCGLNIWYYVAAFVIPFNLICNIVWKVEFWPLTPSPGGKIYGTVLLQSWLVDPSKAKNGKLLFTNFFRLIY